ncbi:MAG TPA: hypothetical protein VHC20_07045 [Candidatus Paceibacterota bacterium]|nr:hypothetical protein [Candidatus Paceibacterota bacterium]
MRRYPYILALLSLLASAAANAQTNISGVINRYTPVVLIDKCNTSVVVRNSFGFAAGDKVLIIQMKGASIDLTDHAGFGDITAYNNAGNYELATVDEVNGFTLVLHNKLAREYDVSGLVQVIRVPQYTNVTVTGTLTAKAWDGQTGGVLAFIASGTVTLNADIDVSGKGFRGEEHTRRCDNGMGSVVGFRYSISLDSANYKGEGVAQFDTAYRSGRGKLANGGGGGNSRASGGGGGNGGAGGKGGMQASYIANYDNGGQGGNALTYDTASAWRKIFLGGAGGNSGPEDVEKVSKGENGGGIVIVQAGMLQANSHAVMANGNDNATGDSNPSPSNVLGGGGGGAGGAVLLDVSSIPNTLVVQINGGRGADTRHNLSCYGPGGGGSGGCLWVSASAKPAAISEQLNGGAAGITHATDPPCKETNYGAVAGGSGIVRMRLIIPVGTIAR